MVTPPAASPSNSSRIPSLDGLRGVAILLVLLGHGYDLLTFLPPSLLGLVGNGKLGVNVFFVLSGYLIYSLSVREVRETGAFHWRNFYLRRMLRIFPCFYLYIGVLLVLRELDLVQIAGPTLASAATFTLNYSHLWIQEAASPDYHVIGHYWTLALEEQFYLTWPLLMLLFARGRLWSVLLGVIVLAPVSRIVCYYLMPESRGQLGMMFHTAFDSIAVGVLLGEMLSAERSRLILLRLAGQGGLLLAAIVFAFIVSPLIGERLRGSYTATIGPTLDLACLTVIITATVHFPGIWLHRLLNWPPLVFVGVISYSLYVWNNLFLYQRGWTVQQFPWNLLCVFGLAILSHYLVERPFLRLKKKLH